MNVDSLKNELGVYLSDQGSPTTSSLLSSCSPSETMLLSKAAVAADGSLNSYMECNRKLLHSYDDHDHHRHNNSKHSNGEDGTEATTSESNDFSDSLLGNSWHSTTSSRRRASLGMAQEAVPEWNSDDQPTATDHEEDVVIRFEELKLHRILGQGYFGTVWLVSTPGSTLQDCDDDSGNCVTPADISSEQVSFCSSTSRKAYALKKLSKFHLLSEDQVESVIRERRILQQLQHHPGIVRIVATYQDPCNVYILTDFLQGGEFFSLLHANNSDASPTTPGNGKHLLPANPLSETSCQFYTACIADALWYMHRQNIVFRDCKPENIMLDASGYPVLIDFGYAKELFQEENNFTAHTLCGTPKYLSPEQIRGSGHSFPVDYFALGIILYEMLCREHPFEFWRDMDEMSLYSSIADAEYLELPPNISADASDLVDRLLRKDPRRRLGTNFTEFQNPVLQHSFLQDLDVALLRNRTIRAPWVPVLDGPLDSRYFDPVVSDGEDHASEDTPLTAKEQLKFAFF